jgi:DNA-directed RNA polymerase specialized sigma54-like protein
MNNRRHQLRQSLDLRLTQRLALTPSLLQKIELLQLNKLELQDMLTQALVENPILEEVTEPEPPKDLGLEEKVPEQAPEARDRERDRDSFQEIDFQYFFDEYLDTGYKNREVEDPEKPSLLHSSVFPMPMSAQQRLPGRSSATSTKPATCFLTWKSCAT